MSKSVVKVIKEWLTIGVKCVFPDVAKVSVRYADFPLGLSRVVLILFGLCSGK